MNNIKLGVNIDHIATLRQARGGIEPEPVTAAAIAELNGADGITVHLREDRRHIQDRDLTLLRQTVQTSLNLEMANIEEIIKIAIKTLPEQVTLVPEKRQEITTEGGLDIIKNFATISKNIARLQKAGITVSVFIEPDKKQIKASKDSGATHIELHTGSYANAKNENKSKQLQRLIIAAEYGAELGLIINAGHGLNYTNILPLLDFKKWNEFNIGHSIISRAVFSGLADAVRDMKKLLFFNS